MKTYSTESESPSFFVLTVLNMRRKALLRPTRGLLYTFVFIFFLLLALLVSKGIYIQVHQKQILTRHAATVNDAIYYDSKNGSNADGLSWSTAWNDVNQINWSVVNPGDTIVIDGGSTACPSNYDFTSTRPGINCGMLYNSTLTIEKSGTATE